MDFFVHPPQAAATRVAPQLRASPIPLCIFEHFIVIGRTLQEIYEIANAYIEKFLSENPGTTVSITIHNLSWNVKVSINGIERNVDIRVFKDTGSDRFIVEVHSVDMVQTDPNYDGFIFELLNWAFSIDETRGPEPQLTEFLSLPENARIRRVVQVFPFPAMPDVGVSV
jgi:hypothetical protein